MVKIARWLLKYFFNEKNITSKQCLRARKTTYNIKNQTFILLTITTVKLNVVPYHSAAHSSEVSPPLGSSIIRADLLLVRMHVQESYRAWIVSVRVVAPFHHPVVVSPPKAVSLIQLSINWPLSVHRHEMIFAIQILPQNLGGCHNNWIATSGCV